MPRYVLWSKAGGLAIFDRDDADKPPPTFGSGRMPGGYFETDAEPGNKTYRILCVWGPGLHDEDMVKDYPNCEPPADTRVVMRVSAETVQDASGRFRLCVQGTGAVFERIINEEGDHPADFFVFVLLADSGHIVDRAPSRE